MSNEATARLLSEFAMSDYALIDESALPKNCPAETLKSAKIINLEIARKTYGIEKFTEAIGLEDKNALAWFNRGRAYLVANDYSRALEDFNKAVSLEDNPRFYNARGIAYFHLKQHKDALAAFEEIVSRVGSASEPEVREQVAMALFNTGVTLDALDRQEQAIAIYDNLIKRFSSAPEPALREQVAAALYNSGVILDALDRKEQAIVIYDNLIRRFGRSPEPALNELIANALSNIGLTYSERGNHEQGIAVYNELLDRFRNATDAAVQEIVATALHNKSVMLTNHGDHEPAIETCDEVISRFGNATKPALWEVVANTFYTKGNALRDLGRPEEAISVWNDLIDRFSNAPELALRKPVADALFNKGLVLCDLGRRELSLGHFNEASALFREGIQVNPAIAPNVVKYFEVYLLKYYGLVQEEDNPSIGYDLSKRVITQAELREYLKEQAILLTERLSEAEERPFPILPERTVKAIIAHGKTHQWDDRKEQGWPYHTNGFVYVHITYRKWVNRGLTREILADADKALSAHLRKKISVEGMPEWLDVPTGAEARLRAIADPVERSKLEIIREFQRDQKRKPTPKANLG